MAVVGIIALVIVGLVVLVGLLVGIRSAGDIRRYFKIRSM